MTKETMNIHKALSELKVMDKRIKSAINKSFVYAKKHSDDKILGLPVETCKNNMKSSFQKVKDLIARRNSLKRAVVISNAVTKVVIGGKEYTVAEAIEMKNHGMEYFKLFLKELIDQYSYTQEIIIENSGEVLEERAEKYILNIIQNKTESKIDTKLINDLRERYIENNKYDLIDPNNVNDMIDTLTTMIEDFESDVDTILSVSNANTIIEFEY